MSATVAAGNASPNPTGFAYTLTFGGDMSATRRTLKVPMCGRRHAFVCFAWPSTGTPIGVFAVEESNSSSDLVIGSRHAVPILTAAQPDGTAGSLALGIETYADYLAFSYTPTSGGTGATITDKDGTSSPTILIKE